jgi:hypothetical protein
MSVADLAKHVGTFGTTVHMHVMHQRVCAVEALITGTSKNLSDVCCTLWLTTGAD